MEKTKWSENVILVDADYVDAVAFNLIVNFERMLNRPIPKADLAQWLRRVFRVQPTGPDAAPASKAAQNPAPVQ